MDTIKEFADVILVVAIIVLFFSCIGALDTGTLNPVVWIATGLIVFSAILRIIDRLLPPEGK